MPEKKVPEVFPARRDGLGKLLNYDYRLTTNIPSSINRVIYANIHANYL